MIICIHISQNSQKVIIACGRIQVCVYHYTIKRQLNVVTTESHDFDNDPGQKKALNYCATMNHVRIDQSVINIFINIIAYFTISFEVLKIK